MSNSCDILVYCDGSLFVKCPPIIISIMPESTTASILLRRCIHLKCVVAVFVTMVCNVWPCEELCCVCNHGV